MVLVLCLVLVLVRMLLLVLMRTLLPVLVLVLVLVQVLVASYAARWSWCIVKLQWPCFGAGCVCRSGGIAVGYSSVPLMHQQPRLAVDTYW